MSVDGARRKEGRKQSFRPFFNHPWTVVDVHGQKSWSGKRVSNSRPQPWQGCALPTELFPHMLLIKQAPQYIVNSWPSQTVWPGKHHFRYAHGWKTVA